MVITMELKHVILRGETYFFRMRVPQDCVEQVGKKEIIYSLKTKDPLMAQANRRNHRRIYKKTKRSVMRLHGEREATRTIWHDVAGLADIAFQVIEIRNGDREEFGFLELLGAVGAGGFTGIAADFFGTK